MLPRPAMVTITNRPVFNLCLGVFLGALLVGCKPPGPKALLDGKRHLEKGRIVAAVDRLEAAVQLMPTNAHAWNYLGIACHRSGQASNAVVAYQRALQVDPDLSEVRLNLGSLWLEQGRVADAKSEFTAYNLRRPNDPAGFYQLALAEMQGREMAAAESHIQKALAIDDDDADAWNAFGLIQLQLGRNADALKSFESALVRRSDFAAARINLAVALQKTGNLGGALEQYRRYLKSKPRPADAELVEQVIGQIEVELKPQPIQIARNVPGPELNQTTQRAQTKMAPTSNVAATAPVSISATTRQPASAVQTEVKAAFTSAAPVNVVSTNRSSPTSSVSTASAAKITPKAGPTPVVRNARVTPLPGDVPRDQSLPTNVTLERAEAKPSNPETGASTAARLVAERHAANGSRALAARKYIHATEAFKAAASADPGWFQAQLNYSAAAIQAGRVEEAVYAGRRAVALQPDSTKARFNLALALKQSARYGEAATQLESLCALKPTDARAHLTLANLYADELRQTERARTHYVKVLEIEPGHPQAAEIHFWLVANPGK
jgi:tetratricopeptide (TPR) repeat protein